MEPPEPCAEPAAFGDTLHIHYTVRDLGGRGGAWEGAVPSWNTSALAGTRGKRFGSEVGALGSSSTWRGEGRSSRLPISLPCFSACSAPAQRSEGWGELREVPALWGFLLLSAQRGTPGCSCEGVAAAAQGPRCVWCAPAEGGY